jgi:hypothetical protein
MADTLTPEEKKRLTQELTNYANEGASDDDLRQFRDAFISELKKKGGTSQGQEQPAQQPTKPSTPSFGQKVTEKITNSASQTQIPLKTGLQVQEEKKAAEKQAKIPTSKYFEVDVEEKQDEAQAPKFADPIIVAKNSQKSKAIFNSVIGDKDIYKMPTAGESKDYATDITSGYLDYLEVVGSDKSDTYKEKYKTLKAKSKDDRTDQDEKFLRQVESEAVGAFYDAKEWELGQVSTQIDDLQKTAVTDEQKAQLNDLYGQYEKKRNSLLGTSSVYAQNKLQYGKIAGTEMADEEAKLRRFEALQAGDGNAVEFFKGIGGAVANGVLSIAQVPKVFGDLVGDTDYDWSDEMYDMVSGQKSDLDREFGAPLPQGKSMTDLPFSARLAVVGGNAIGSAGLFAAGGGLIGATSNLGKAAATFGTAFLTSESGYYQEALDAGMSPQEAALAGTYLAAQTALIESIIPDIKYFEPSAFRKSVMQAVSSGIKSGLPVKEAAKLALKNTIKAIPESAVAYGKTGIKEAGEELLGQVGEDAGKVALNAAGERQYFNDTFNPESYTDAILGGFIAGGGMSVFSRPTAKSPVQEEVMREIVERRPQETQKGTASDKINKEDLSALDDVTEIYNAMSSHSGWSVMSREEQNHALALAQQAQVMKKEQERMNELRIPDERKDAEIKSLEDEVNQMFSVQMEQDKQKSKDAKIKAIEDDFNKSMEGEEFPVQEDERDQEIVELQKQREEKGVSELDTFLGDMKPMVPFAVERTEQGLPVAQSVKQAASNYLYKKYKELTDMKSDPNRMMTRGQIASVQKQLEQDIRTLEGTTQEKTETRDQENIQGIPSQVREGQEPVAAKPVEVPSAEAPETGGVLQAQEKVTPTTGAAPEVTAEPTVKPSRRERLAKMFETSDGEIAAEKVASFLGEANIGVEVLDPKSFEERGKQRNFEGSADGIFLVDNNTGKIYLNKERIKGAEGKTIAFHEGIHPVVNIIRNTNPKLYSAIVDGLKAEAVKNAGVAEAADAVAASEYYQEQGPSAIEDETVVETMARVAAGDIDIDTFDPSFREKFIEFMNKLAKMLGLKAIAVNSPRMEVKRLADQLSKALNEGGKLSDVVGKENVMSYENNLAQESGTIETGSVVYAGQASAKIKRGSKVKNPYRESVDLPVRTLQSLLDEYGDNVIVVNSDPTGLGTVRLPSGKVVELDGGIGYMAIQENIDAGVGFASSSDARVKFLYKTANQMNADGKLKNGKVLVLVMVQKADSMLGNNYTPDYVADALAKIPQDVISKEKLTDLLVEPLKKETFKSFFYQESKIPKMKPYKNNSKKTAEENKKLKEEYIKKYNAEVAKITESNAKKKADGLARIDAIEAEIRAVDPRTAHDEMVRIFHELSFVQAQKYFDNILGSYTNKTTKYGLEISRLLYEHAGADQRNLFQVLGEKSLVDQLIQDPKAWGYAVAAFVHNTAKQTGKLGGIKHNLFNAKFQGDERFILAEAHKVNDIMTEFNEQQVKKVEEGLKRGAVFAEQQASQGMYPSGKAVIPATKGVELESLQKTKGRFQASKDIDRSKQPKAQNKKTFPLEKARELLSKAEYTSLPSALELLAEYPKYLDNVAKVILTQRQKLLDGKMPVRDVAKAYILTQGSIGSDFRYKDVLEKDLKAVGLTWKSGKDDISLFEEDGKIRPEELTAWWLGTPNGQKALNDLEKGIVNESAFNELEAIRRSYGKNNFRLNSVFGNRKADRFDYGQKPEKKNEFNLANVVELTDAINETKGDNAKLQELLTKVKGVSEGKKGFIGHMLGIGNMPTVDAVELNFWFTGKGEAKVKDLDEIKAQTITAIRENISALNEDVYKEISGRIKQLSEQIAEKYPDVNIPEAAMQHVLHHWIWDKARQSATTHRGMYQALGQYSMLKRNPLDKRIDEAIDRKKYFVANDMGGVDVYTPENYIKVLQEFVDTGAISGKAAPYTQLTERQFPLEYVNGISLLRLTDSDRSFVQDEIDYVKSKMAKGQSSMVKRTSAEVRQLMEDSMDSVDQDIADGVDAQTAVEDNITSQDWYGELTPKQKEQFDEIIKDEFGVTPKAPVAKATGVKATIANIIDNYYKLKDGDRSARAAINEILGQDPKLKYIYDNISKINKQLQDAGVITDKTDGCP